MRASEPLRHCLSGNSKTYHLQCNAWRMRKMSGLECLTWMNEIEMSPSVAAKKKIEKSSRKWKFIFCSDVFFVCKCQNTKIRQIPAATTPPPPSQEKNIYFVAIFHSKIEKRNLLWIFFFITRACLSFLQSSFVLFKWSAHKNYFLIHSIESFWLRFSQWAEQWLQEWTN